MGSNYSPWPNTVLKDIEIVKKGSSNSKLVSGAALMLSLWALFLLSAMVISWALDIDSRLVLSGNANRVLAAEAMAASGVDVALHPSIALSSPNLHRKMGERERYDVSVTGEGGRLNLNWLTAGEDPTRLGILRRYLELKGVEMNDRDTMIDSLLDWVSPNIGLHHLNAPPESDDYHPPHAPLTSVEELKKVFGWTEFTSKLNWDEDFTINSSGPIDLAWASRDVLRALRIGDDVVDRFLQLRRGSDGIDGTADDFQFTKSVTTGSVPPEVQTALGLTGEQFQQIASLVTFKDQVFRIMSMGKSGDVTRSLQVIVRKGGVIPQLISWKEI
jgi:type II secretory pathway component PulK